MGLDLDPAVLSSQVLYHLLSQWDDARWQVKGASPACVSRRKPFSRVCVSWNYFQGGIESQDEERRSDSSRTFLQAVGRALCCVTSLLWSDSAGNINVLVVDDRVESKYHSAGPQVLRSLLFDTKMLPRETSVPTKGPNAAWKVLNGCSKAILGPLWSHDWVTR